MPLSAGTSLQSIRAGRSRVLLAFVLVALGSCFFRLVFLQIVRGPAFSQASENNHTQVLVERAPRGRILDRNGEVLADDRPVFVALFSPLGLVAGDFPVVISRLSTILEVPEAELERRLYAAIRAKSMMRISDRLSRSQAFRILQARTHLPGVSLTIEEQRFYPEEMLASHVLGYVGQITDEELARLSEQGYHSGDFVGKSGVEHKYDPSLQGQDGGYLIEVDARGRQVRVIRHLQPQAGKDLVLTLDAKITRLAEQRIRQTGRPGAAVVMNPQTGELLAVASSPGFNPNLFLPLGDSDERKQLLADPKLPLYNRAIQALYPPGSTFKVITALAGLEEKHLDPNETVFCPGQYVYGKDKRVFKCWKPHGHGTVSYMNAMAQSCDVYFYQLGQKIGPDAIERTAKLFGLGQTTGVDLPHEKRWPLPIAYSNQLAARARRKPFWPGGETLNYAIGQGLLQVTPLQMAGVISTIANEGSVWQPYLAAETRRYGEAPEKIGTPKMVRQLAIAPDHWKLVRKSLLEVVHSGTGVAAQLKDIDVAGKTGTAQAPKDKKDHAWFVAFAPYDQPKVACAVVVENGGHGGSAAAPIAHDLLAMALDPKQLTQGGERTVDGD